MSNKLKEICKGKEIVVKDAFGNLIEHPTKTMKILDYHVWDDVVYLYVRETKITKMDIVIYILVSLLMIFLTMIAGS